MGARSLVRPARPLYDQDFVVWASETARLLREGRFEEIDVQNLAEEVEAMANRDRRELVSRLSVLIQHLLKWQRQPGRRSRSWQSTIATQRAELEHLFRQSPSLRRDVPESVREAYAPAVKLASIETGLAARGFPAECPFSAAQILDDEFLPGR